MNYSRQYKVLNFYFPMNQLLMFLINLLFIVVDVKAQTSGHGVLPSQQDKGHNFQPSLAVVIGVLTIMFILTFILLMYAKFCHRTSSVQNHQQIQAGLSQSRSRFSGIDKSVIESLPFFRFSSLRGSRKGLECAVCLAKFENIEILRLLPKCKHAFHIDCIDQWLEKHSSCPLCRHRVGPDDLSFFSYSNSLRFLQNQSEMEDDPEIELFVQREEDDNGSSRFSICSSFRRLDKNKGKKEEELPIQESCDSDQEDKRDLHKYNHMIIVSNVVLKNRWSNVSSSDLMLLNTEMLNAISSNRFSSDTNPSQLKVIEDPQEMNIREEMKRKRVFDSKFSRMKQKSDSFPVSTILPTASESNSDSGRRSNTSYPVEKRSMSEITVHPRFSEFNMRHNTRETPLTENNVEEKIRSVWLPIARRTVEWFANGEKRNSQPHKSRQSLNVYI